MTQEEKAEAYDRAIEKSKKFYILCKKCGAKDTVDFLEDTFPELKESEGEKIRKEILEYFQQFKNEELRGVNISGWIDWLEKQGIHANFRHKIQIGDKVTRNKDGILVNISQLNRIAKKHKKQGKQKSIEWKQENREELTEFENAMMHIGGSFFGENAGLDPNDTDTIKEQAELLLELAPKTEWSEDDKEMFDYALDMVEWYDGKNKKRVRLVSNWLKSIKDRYTWKPSDEQLYFLHWLATNVLTDGEVDKKASEILYTLYDDLKKL